MARQPPPDRFLSVAEVADLIGLDASTIRNCQCGTDELIRVKLGSRTVFSFNDVQAWIKRRLRQARDDRRAAAAAAGDLHKKATEQLRRKQIMKQAMFRIIK